MTKYRYRLVSRLATLSNYKYKDKDAAETIVCNKQLQAAFPQVFSSEGIPFYYDHAGGYSRKESDFLAGTTFLVSLVSCCTLPSFLKSESREKGKVSLLDISSAKVEFSRIRRQDRVGTLLSPLAMLCCPGKYGNIGQEFDQSRKFSSREIWLGGVGGKLLSQSGDNTGTNLYDLNDAEIYGIAVALKQLEDRGIVNDATVANAAKLREERNRLELVRQEAERQRRAAEAKKRQAEIARAERLKQLTKQQLANQQLANQQVAQQQIVPPAAVPTYRTTKCRRVQGKDYAYEFEVEIASNNTDPLNAFALIQYQYADVIKNMYLTSHPNADVGNIAVDFPYYELLNARVSGLAVVISIIPVAVKYDPLTRRGVVSVRFGAGQYEEARAWAKKNIETLVRDKNIALETGSLPPQARYYSLGETLKDGNILEIEFRTE